MIRIRPAGTWPNDPAVAAAARRGVGAAREAVRAAVDAFALEVDGVDLAAGRAEGPVLATTESLVRTVARLLGGARQASVAFHDGGVDLVLRRRGSSALLTVVAPGPPSRVLARDVEVELAALASAALEAAAQVFAELAAAAPSAVGSREARRVEEAARRLRSVRTARPGGAAPSPPWRAVSPGRSAPGPTVQASWHDEEGLVSAYEGGRPDLGSLLVPGEVTVASGGEAIAALQGYPFLLLRDLGALADRLLAAVRRGEARFDGELPHASRAGGSRSAAGRARGAPAPGRDPARGALSLDLAGGRIAAPAGGWHDCPPLALVRAASEVAARFGRDVRRRNPRQEENALLADLEAAAAARLAEVDELSRGELVAEPARAADASAGGRVVGPPMQPLGPGRLRRLALRRLGTVEVGPLAGVGLFPCGALAVAAGQHAIAALDRSTGAVSWRAAGCDGALALPGALAAVRHCALEVHALRTGRLLWRRALRAGPPSAAAAFRRGPWVLAEQGAATAVDPASGRTLWRFEAPGALRLYVAGAGDVVLLAADTGTLSALDPTGRTVWRLRAAGPMLHPPTPVRGAVLALSARGPGAELVAVELASGHRRWASSLEFAPAGPPIPWGPAFAVAGQSGGDAEVARVGPEGAVAWTTSPPLGAPPVLAAAGRLVVVQDPSGALAALDASGRAAWSRPAPAGPRPPQAAAPVLARNLVLPAGEALSALDARTGELVAAVPGIAPARILADAALRIVAVESGGVAAAYRLGTHLSVV